MIMETGHAAIIVIIFCGSITNQGRPGLVVTPFFLGSTAHQQNIPQKSYLDESLKS